MVRQRRGLPNMPLEVLTMIMCLLMGPEDVSTAWFDFRRVCRTLKKAVEIAVRIHILPTVNLQFSASPWNTIQVFGTSLVLRRTGTIPLTFSGLTVDETRAIFGLMKWGSRAVSQTSSVNPAWNAQLAGSSNFLIQPNTSDSANAAFQKLKKDLECFASARLMPGPLQAQSPLITSTCAARLPTYEDITLDLERVQITLPWKPMISSLLEEQGIIAKSLKALALKDVERDDWINGATPSRKEEALKLALSSKRCRGTRFSTAFAHAVKRRNQERQGQWPDDKALYDVNAAVQHSRSHNLIYYRGWNVTAVDFKNVWYQE